MELMFVENILQNVMGIVIFRVGRRDGVPVPLA